MYSRGRFDAPRVGTYDMTQTRRQRYIIVSISAWLHSLDFWMALLHSR